MVSLYVSIGSTDPTFLYVFCFQRPRKVGAKYTGMNIAPDEHVQPQLMFDYDGKRDRWNGYNPEEHMKIVEEYAKVDLVCRCYSSLGKDVVFGFTVRRNVCLHTAAVRPCVVSVIEKQVHAVVAGFTRNREIQI